MAETGPDHPQEPGPPDLGAPAAPDLAAPPSSRRDMQAAWEEQVLAAPIPRCGNAWKEPVVVAGVGHRHAIVTHTCDKKIAHITEHECECGRKWPKL